MYKDNKLSIKLLSGICGLSDNWKYYLPENSKALEDFRESLSISIKTSIQTVPPPKDSERAMKIFVGDEQKWQDSQSVIDAFIQIWPVILRFIAELSNETVELLYFSGNATHDELFSLWPYLPFEFEDNNRFYVSEISKLKSTQRSVPMWFCVEYSHEFFEQLATPERCELGYGTTIMGISVADAEVEKYLQKDLIDKSVLEEILQEKYLRCWWLCDPDFEGMTIWHKDYSGKDMLGNLRSLIENKAEQIGLDLE